MDLPEDLGGAFPLRGVQGPQEAVLEACARRQWTLAVAESCTGGLLGARLTTVPGSSDCFAGGVIAYSDRIKVSMLDVPPGLLRVHGAVSDPVAAAMAEGIVRRAGAQCGISITGVAGPSGGTAEKPVGTVWVAVALPSKTVSRRFHFSGGRGEIRDQAVRAAMDLFLEAVGP
ncbi:MAG: CinA family protein [bacterium]|nr:MAG: CinA family protein [bacterium]